jgi:hypothetical protein
MAVNPVTIQLAASAGSAIASRFSKKSDGTTGQPGQSGQSSPDGYQLAGKAIKSWDDSTFRQETAIRGPPPKESVSMVKYIVIAVIIIAVLLIYYGVGRKWEQPPKYQSVFDNFTVTRAADVHKPLAPMVSNSAMVFGVMPRHPVRIN